LGAVGLGAELMLWRYVGGCGVAEQSDAVEILWGLWGCGAELMLWRYVGGCGPAEES
jgi:hypothetical protein